MFDVLEAKTMTFLAKKLNQKTLKQKLQEAYDKDESLYGLTPEEILTIIKEWLTQKHQEWQGTKAPYDEIAQLLEELNQ